VPIPFSDVDDLEALGAAGYLKIESSPAGANGSGLGAVGALFLVNARGEPLEFAYNRVAVPNTFLWRQADLQRHAHKKLVTSLLAICVRAPSLLLCLADELPETLFAQEVRVAVPVGWMHPPRQITDHATGEIVEEPPQVAWIPAPPDPDTSERALFERLSRHGLLFEPFERAAIGLAEAYASDTPFP
jgi:hypothetical protein